MTAELEYSYLDVNFMLRVSEDVMSRAVRVKVAAKDKIKRIFDNNVVTLSNQVSNEIPVQTVEETGLKALIDVSDEKLTDLNNKLNAMQQQKNVPSTTKRAVLFTNALSGKIRKVTDKMFDGMPGVEKVNSDLPSVEISNHLGGEVLPSAWFNAPADIKVPELNSVPVQEEKTEEVPNETVEMPSLENAISNEVAVPNVISPEAVENSEVSENVTNAIEVSNEELTSFIPNLEADFVKEPQNLSEAPVSTEIKPVELPKIDLDVNPYEFTFEPAHLDIEKAFVPEPREISAQEEPKKDRVDFEKNIQYEMPVANDNVENSNVTLPESVKTEEVVDKKPKMSIEDKIAEILSRKNAINDKKEDVKVSVVSEEEPNEDLDKNMRSDKPEMTQARVMARLQRVNNSMKERDATIKSLTLKYESLKKEAADAKSKMSGYEAVVSDLTIRNNMLVQENERLSAKLKDSETENQSIVSGLEGQVSELSQLRTEESENSKKMIADLKEKYESEIAALKEKHSKEIAAVNESKEKQIKAIYATISEALGDSYDSDYDAGHSLAA